MKCILDVRRGFFKGEYRDYVEIKGECVGDPPSIKGPILAQVNVDLKELKKKWKSVKDEKNKTK